ncbi:multidrug effflux MFS transporter [Dysgonomonas sp. 511]|uniref:multidrug effflux MFS transporter n=1 Tax=Dysgonomonas sp. 511 TaxID=2302930 RepID=UPI0013D41216|nr:multidrug effflux MFS transporter [Dysgonomonas sp. 511]NDV77419.1 Bcr/CflA family efflux MFS transporter [Dysgonomonas sp. 511]
MKNFSLTQWVIVLNLSLLTALEPLSIDLYLPGFLLISETFGTDIAAVQISLSTFLAGFAIGQLIWGPLADKFGRKKPILVSLVIFTIASVACIYVRTIEQLWLVRFLQAIGGCAGVVISRAVVTDYFDKSQTLKIFALLALIMGIAPIVAPTIGNGVLLLFSWEGLFGAMATMGVLLFLFTLFFLPETYTPASHTDEKNVIRGYIEILHNKRFVIYSLIAGIVNGALMVYVANGPFLIMEKGGFSNSAFSIIFAVNASGLMLASYLTGILQKHIATNKLVKLALFAMTAMSVVMLAAMYAKVDMRIILFMLFFYVFPIGILFPATTELAITPFANSNNTGTASALFGSIQLAMAFICTLASGFISDGSIVAVGTSFFFCSILAFVIVFVKIDLNKEYSNYSAK